MKWLIIGGICFIISILFYLLKKFWVRKLKQRVEVYSLNKTILILGFICIVIGLLEKSGVLIHADSKLQFEVSIIIAMVLGIFSVFSFTVARKVENLIRLKIRSFEDFTEHAHKVLHDDSKEYKVMLRYPYFGLKPSVEKRVDELSKERGQININNRIINLSGKENFHIICGNRNIRINFLNELNEKKELSKEGQIFLDKEKKGEDTYHLETLKSHRENISFLDKRNQIHIVASDYQVVWGNIEKLGRCVGFWSQDTHIVDSFRRMFDTFWDDLANPNDI